MNPRAIPRSSIGEKLPLGGVEAVFFYIVTYAAMTIGAFAIIHYLDTPERPVETVEDLAGLGRSHPGVALLMALFLFGTDQVWRVLLSMKPIQVLQIPKQQQKNVDRDRPLW